QEQVTRQRRVRMFLSHLRRLLTQPFKRQKQVRQSPMFMRVTRKQVGSAMTAIYTKRLSNAYASQRQMSLSTSLQVVAVTGYQAKKTRHVVVKGLISKHLKNVMNRSENSCRKCAH